MVKNGWFWHKKAKMWENSHQNCKNIQYPTILFKINLKKLIPRYHKQSLAILKHKIEQMNQACQWSLRIKYLKYFVKLSSNDYFLGSNDYLKIYLCIFMVQFCLIDFAKLRHTFSYRQLVYICMGAKITVQPAVSIRPDFAQIA